ncbi:MAG: Trm112 family protein [Alphaproteobacteria bacterium]
MSEEQTGPARRSGIDPKLLELLVCPQVKTVGSLRYDAEAQELVSEQAGLAYPIRDGIPILVADEARVLDTDRRTR